MMMRGIRPWLALCVFAGAAWLVAGPSFTLAGDPAAAPPPATQGGSSGPRLEGFVDGDYVDRDHLSQVLWAEAKEAKWTYERNMEAIDLLNQGASIREIGELFRQEAPGADEGPAARPREKLREAFGKLRERRRQVNVNDEESIDLFMAEVKQTHPRYHEWLSRLREEAPARFEANFREWRDSPGVFELRARAGLLERDIREKALEYVRTPEGDARRQPERELRALLKQQFETTLDMSRMRLIAATKIVQQISRQIEEHQANVEARIDERFRQVIDRAEANVRAVESTGERRPRPARQGRGAGR